MDKMTDKKLRAGFTLIELLVVISIIAVLMAVLMPALRRARMQAQSLVCRTQLRDIGTAMRLYAADNSNKLPSSAASPSETQGYSGQEAADSQHRWYVRINPYYNKSGAQEAYDYNLYRCPAMQKKWQGEGGAGIYGYNMFFFYPKDYNSGNFMNLRWRKSSSIIRPSDFPLMADLSAEDPLNERGDKDRGGVILKAFNPHPAAYEYGWMGGEWALSQHDHWGPAPNHGNSNCNFLFGDGSVGSRDVCDEQAWPWTGQSRVQRRLNGSKAFHPQRNVSILPPR
jgi:prepilin-type N-terminal cleavage/methylation domain-containing protein/prepilin-type processing-associated H-X9-DG protein